MSLLECCIVFAVALIATVALVPLAKRIAFVVDAIDYPSARRVNKKPIPRLGGVAMFGGLAAALLALAVGLSVGWIEPFEPHPTLTVWYPGVVLGVAFMFAVGVVDDVKGLNPKAKMLGQIVAASIVAGSGVLLSSIYNPFSREFIEFGWFSYPLTIFYLVAFANVINLIDGLDGLASGITAIAAIAILVFAVLTQRADATFLSIALIAVCIGFLFYNFNPASIFMGDSGSLLLGFSLGVASLFAVARSALFVSLLVPILAAGVPIMDTAFAIVRRLAAHRPIDEADKGHIHHRLLNAGFSQRSTVLIMWSWTAALTLCAILVTRIHGVARIPIALVVVGVTAFAIWKLHLLKPALIHHYEPKGTAEETKDNCLREDA